MPEDPSPWTVADPSSPKAAGPCADSVAVNSGLSRDRLEMVEEYDDMYLEMRLGTHR
jgi:hypothetical protein